MVSETHYIVHCTLNTAHYTLYDVNYKMYDVNYNCVPCTVQHKLYYVHYKMYTVIYKLYIVHYKTGYCIIHPVHYTMLATHCILNTPSCTILHTTNCVSYTALCSLHIASCTPTPLQSCCVPSVSVFVFTSFGRKKEEAGKEATILCLEAQCVRIDIYWDVMDSHRHALLGSSKRHYRRSSNIYLLIYWAV